MNDLPSHAAARPRRPTRRATLATGAAVLALPFIGRPAHANFAWTLFSQQQNPASAVVRGLRRLSDLMRDRTNGAVALTIRTAGTLPIDANNVLEAVGARKVEMGDDSAYNAIIPAATVLRLPLLITSPEEWDKAAAQARPLLEAELQKRGLVLLGHYRSAQQTFWSRLRATSFADIARQKVRVSSVEQAEFLRHYLGLHLSMSTVEFTEALAAGKADGAFTTAFQVARFWKAQLKRVYLAGPNYLDGVIVAGRAPLEQMPADLSAALTAAVHEAATWIGRTQDTEETQLVRQLSGEGLVATPADPKEIAEGAQKLAQYWDNWVRLRGGATEELLAAIRQDLDR